MAAAEGVHRLANVRMADGIRLATVRRGVDPRHFTLLAFGGAAGLHASAVARELGMQRVAVPIFAAGLSAWGMLHTDLRYEMARSELASGGVPEDAVLRTIWAGLERKAAPASHPGSAARSRQGAPPICAMANRSSRLPCRSRRSSGTRQASRGRVTDAFHARHETLFT